MKKLALLSTVLALLSISLYADDPAKIKGEATCAKCGLHLTDSCQDAITVTGADGKKEVILCDKNAVAKDFHGTICKGTANVTAEGTITEKDGKKVITLTKIDEAK